VKKSKKFIQLRKKLRKKIKFFTLLTQTFLVLLFINSIIIIVVLGFPSLRDGFASVIMFSQTISPASSSPQPQPQSPPSSPLAAIGSSGGSVGIFPTSFSQAQTQSVALPGISNPIPFHPASPVPSLNPSGLFTAPDSQLTQTEQVSYQKSQFPSQSKLDLFPNTSSFVTEEVLSANTSRIAENPSNTSNLPPIQAGENNQKQSPPYTSILLFFICLEVLLMICLFFSTLILYFLKKFKY